MLFYIFIALASAIAIFRTCKKCKDSQSDFTRLYRNYNPKRNIIPKEKLQEVLLMKSLAFFNYPKSHISHKLFKTIEFFTAETIISHCIDIMKCNDSYKNIKSIVKITNILEEYKNIFPDNYSVIESLVYRIYINSLHVETDIYMLYKTINEVLKTLTKIKINPVMLLLYKNYYWYPKLHYRVKHLIHFVKMNVKK